MSVQDTLEERGNRYGVFSEQAKIAQNLKFAMRGGRNWSGLPMDMRESLDMICNKVARILNGDPYYADSWHDIAGYAQLIEKDLPKETT